MTEPAENIIELKAMAYDLYAQIQDLQRQLIEVNQRIAQCPPPSQQTGS